MLDDQTLATILTICELMKQSGNGVKTPNSSRLTIVARQL